EVEVRVLDAADDALGDGHLLAAHRVAVGLDRGPDGGKVLLEGQRGVGGVERGAFLLAAQADHRQVDAPRDRHQLGPQAVGAVRRLDEDLGRVLDHVGVGQDKPALDHEAGPGELLGGGPRPGLLEVRGPVRGIDLDDRVAHGLRRRGGGGAQAHGKNEQHPHHRAPGRTAGPGTHGTAPGAARPYDAAWQGSSSVSTTTMRTPDAWGAPSGTTGSAWTSAGRTW